jgi:hypothetical protein
MQINFWKSHASPEAGRCVGNPTYCDSKACSPSELVGVMERFIHRENIKHYEKLLQTTTDEAERQRIQKLLEEERKRMPETPPARRRA